jgi:hypothetical protein
VGESVEPSGPLPRPEPRVTASDHGGEGGGTNTTEQQVRSRDRSPQPESMAVGGSDDNRQRTEADVGNKEVDGRHSPLDTDVGVVADGEPSREVERLHPSLSTPSLPPTENADSM